MYLYMPYDSQNIHQTFPQTAFINRCL
jgi:hypothetical protein